MSTTNHHHYSPGASFHEAVSPVISFIQFFGILPLKGLKSYDFRAIKFAYISFSMLSCLTFIVCDLIVIASCIVYYRGKSAWNLFNASKYLNDICMYRMNDSQCCYSSLNSWCNFSLDKSSYLSGVPLFGI